MRDVTPLDRSIPSRPATCTRSGSGSPAKSATILRCTYACWPMASDMSLLGTGNRPHGLTWFDPKLMSASLDHAIWFHAPVKFSDWHLYAMDSPFAGSGRSFNRGSIYNQDGKLVASVAQEGLMRQKKPKS